MISNEDLTRVRDQFGVADAQVLRDHLISHVLAALTQMPESGDLVFFGGTALSRTLLPDLRLSEDIDLITTGRRSDVATRITESIDDRLARTHGATEWLPPLDQTKGAEPAVLRVDGGITVQVQLLSQTGYPTWPTIEATLEQRYTDAPPARLHVLTPAAFVAAKLAAWHDRKAPRDLYDLWALTQAGHLTQEALNLYVRFGPTGKPPTERDFTDIPTASAWSTALDHQGHIGVDPEMAGRTVNDAVHTMAQPS